MSHSSANASERRPQLDASLHVVQADICLARMQPTDARHIYARILGSVAPGHPIALLNRSLCYLVEGYPALAAADAYRAMMAVTWAKNGQKNNPGAKYIKLYKSCLEYAKLHEQIWANEPTCYIGSRKYRFLSNPLAAIGANDIKRKNPGTSETGEILNIANDLILKSYYRLALSLWKCGGGAIQDALLMLHVARDLPFCSADDKTQFDDLENHILHYLNKIMSTEKRIHKDDLGWHEEHGIRGLLRTRSTKIRRQQYPWDDSTPSDGNVASILPELQSLAKQVAPNCEIVYWPEAGKAPKFALQASKNLTDTCIFDERLGLVVTSGPGYICEGCGSSLEVTDLAKSDAKQAASRVAQLEEEASKCTSSSQRHEKTSELEEYITTGPQGYQVCFSLCGTAFCSYDCHEQTVLTYHSTMCGMGLDETIDNSTTTWNWKDTPSSSKKRLIGKLLLRIIATLEANNGHPLEVPWLRILDGDLDQKASQSSYDNDANLSLDCESPTPLSKLFPTYGTSAMYTEEEMLQAEAMMDWSFETHIRQPIHNLYTIGGSRLALDITRFDGWVINTLIAKIEIGMRATPYTRFRVVFDNWCKPREHGCYVPPGDPEGSDSPTQIGKANECKEINWIASLHPLMTLVREVPLGSPIKPNVRLLEQHDRMYCQMVNSVSGEINPTGLGTAENGFQGTYIAAHTLLLRDMGDHVELLFGKDSSTHASFDTGNLPAQNLDKLLASDPPEIGSDSEMDIDAGSSDTLDGAPRMDVEMSEG